MNIAGIIGARTIRRVSAFGDFCRFTGQSLSWIFGVVTHWRNLRLVFPQFFEVATRSVPVVMITGMFVGMVLAVQAVMQFKALGLDAKLGTIVNLSALRELGPVLAGMMLAGRVGGGITAELGTMRVTEQIDALRAMGADPLRVLVIPRFLACVLMSPVLVMYTSVMAILGGFAISVYVYGINAKDFWESSAMSIGYFDIFQGPVKSLFFGAAISLVSCYKGFRCQAGAAGVGRACTEGFVISCMAILVLDLFIGMFLNTLEVFFYGMRSIF
ncbi:MAG: ABC transporter permease [Planctomycetaceae bacterium]|nr:MAG: ABC transporter permease [Planctomycetaceae bacterium]